MRAHCRLLWPSGWPECRHQYRGTWLLAADRACMLYQFCLFQLTACSVFHSLSLCIYVYIVSLYLSLSALCVRLVHVVQVPPVLYFGNEEQKKRIALPVLKVCALFMCPCVSVLAVLGRSSWFCPPLSTSALPGADIAHILLCHYAPDLPYSSDHTRDIYFFLRNCKGK